MSSIDFDKVLVMVGERGRYQTVMFFILCIPATIPVAFLAFSNVFTNATPDHWCRAPPEYNGVNISEADLKLMTIPYRIRGDGVKMFSKCTMYDLNIADVLEAVSKTEDKNKVNNDALQRFDDGAKHDDDSVGFGVVKSSTEFLGGSLMGRDKFYISDEWRRRFEELVLNGSLPTVNCKHGWEYDKSYYDRTLVTESDLVCDLSWWPQTSTALFYVGSIFGNVIFGWVADRWGRRRSVLWMIVLEVLLSIVTSFSNNYITYVILRAFSGLFFPALYQIPFVLGIEMMGPSHRTFAGMIICTLFAGGMCLLSLLAYLLRDWFKLSLATSVPFLLLFSYYWIIPESPRWLISRGRLDEAEQIVQTMAKFNGATIPKRLLHKLHEESTTMSPLIPMANMRSRISASNMNGKNALRSNNEEQYNSRNSHINKIYKSGLEQYDKIDETKIMRSNEPQNMELLNEDAEENTQRPLTYPTGMFAHCPKNKSIQFTDERTEFYDQKRDASTCETGILDSSGTLDNERKIHMERFSDRRCSRLEDRMPSFKYLRSPSLRVDSITIKSASNQEATMLDIFRYPNIRKKFFLLTFDWIANAVVYNGLSYNATNLGVNDFLAFFIAAAIELPSYLLAWKLMDRWGRRWVLCIALATGGFGCLSCMFVPEEKVWITVTLAMIGKFGIAASFAVFYVFVGELFPTVLRSQAMGLASLLVSVGLLTFPYILQLAVYSRNLPLIVLGALSLSGAVASVFLPETLDTPMPETLQEGEDFGKDFKIFSVPRRRRHVTSET